eukprot:SAG31_NODE_8303_length_1477_cov_6.291727_1_plen_95_part_00
MYTRACTFCPVMSGSMSDSDMEAVMSGAGVDSEEATRLLKAARGSVDLAVVRAHNERRQREKAAERAASTPVPGAQLDRAGSADLVPTYDRAHA